MGIEGGYFSQEDKAEENGEKLGKSILVTRNMSSRELYRYYNGEDIKQENKMTDYERMFNTAESNALYFSPNRKEVKGKCPDDNSLVDTSGKILDFEDIRATWNIGNGAYTNSYITKNVMVEFATREKPKVCFGFYKGEWVKEYTYDNYNRDTFIITRIYNPETKQVVYERGKDTEENIEEIIKAMQKEEEERRNELKAINNQLKDYYSEEQAENYYKQNYLSKKERKKIKDSFKHKKRRY